MIVYISIGNSDDRLTQRQWYDFVARVDGYIEYLAEGREANVHGRWFSVPDAPWQNACWCVELAVDDVTNAAAVLKARLRDLATEYHQDSIAWAVAETEFLRGTDA